MKPACYFRYSALREGDKGHEVWALQLCLNGVGYGTTADGAFGPQTKRRVLEFQERENLEADGLAGQVTQRRMFIRVAHPLQRELLIPVGLARGFAEGESGFYCGAVDCRTAGGMDCGWMGLRVYESQYGSEIAWYRAYHGPTAVRVALADLRSTYEEFHEEYNQPVERAWKLAVGSHNWPAAALHYAHNDSNWQYREALPDGRIVYRWMDEPAHWITRLGVPGVETGHQWFAHYVRTKIHYVKSWTP